MFFSKLFSACTVQILLFAAKNPDWHTKGAQILQLLFIFPRDFNLGVWQALKMCARVCVCCLNNHPIEINQLFTVFINPIGLTGFLGKLLRHPGDISEIVSELIRFNGLLFSQTALIALGRLFHMWRLRYVYVHVCVSTFTHTHTQRLQEALSIFCGKSLFLVMQIDC